MGNIRSNMGLPYYPRGVIYQIDFDTAVNRLQKMENLPKTTDNFFSLSR
jgi:hypothetical protein